MIRIQLLGPKIIVEVLNMVASCDVVGLWADSLHCFVASRLALDGRIGRVSELPHLTSARNQSD